jgi:aminoglycoside phosphotransferase (APT) family kinase protein
LTEVAAILEGLGIPFDGVLPEDRGSPDRTHVYVFDEVVVKLNQQAGSNRLIRERNALALLRGSSLRVPEFVADGEDWIVMTRLAGDPPPDALVPPEQASPELAYQLGALTAQLHAGPAPPGFGTWTEVDFTLREECENRIRALHGLGVDYDIVERSELDAARDLLLNRLDVLASAPQDPMLVHRDVQPRNVLVDASGTVTALLDFEASGGGDPAEDFKCVGLDWHRPGFAAFVSGYREDGGEVDEAFAERVPVYVAYWAFAALAYLGGFAPHFLPVAREAIARVKRGEVPPI